MSVTGGKVSARPARERRRQHATALRPWGDLCVPTVQRQHAAEIAGLVSVSTAGIGVAASVDDAAVLELFTKKTAATLD